MTNDITITQEQADGSLKKVTLPTASRDFILATSAAAQAALLFSAMADVIFTSAGTTTYTDTGKFRRIFCQAGAGAYTRKIVLSTAGRVAGEVISFLAAWDAASGGKLEIYDGSDTGTLLFSYTASATLNGVGKLEFMFDSTATEWIASAPNQVFETALSTLLIAFYKLSDLTNSSGPGGVLTNSGTVTFVAGKIGNCATFDGTNYLQQAALSIVGDYSVSLWAKIPVLADWKIIVSKYPHFAVMMMADGSIALGDASTWSVATAAATVVADTWFHVCVTCTAGVSSLFIDGAFKVDTGANPALHLETVSGSSPFWISGDGTTADTIAKLVDALAIYNYALTAPEIAALYNGGAGYEPA
jgi:hypothetical protein